MDVDKQTYGALQELYKVDGIAAIVKIAAHIAYVGDVQYLQMDNADGTPGLVLGRLTGDSGRRHSQLPGTSRSIRSMEQEKTTTTTADVAPEAEQKVKTREVEVQFTVKWVNFTYTVEEATNGVDAVDQALASYKENGLEEFTITAGNEECYDLDDIFHVAEDFTKATDENGNDVVGWEEWIDEE